jgi:hypothetical protein
MENFAPNNQDELYQPYDSGLALMFNFDNVAEI